MKLKERPFVNSATLYGSEKFARAVCQILRPQTEVFSRMFSMWGLIHPPAECQNKSHHYQPCSNDLALIASGGPHRHD